jgi:hypothetical protein
MTRVMLDCHEFRLKLPDEHGACLLRKV